MRRHIRKRSRWWQMKRTTKSFQFRWPQFTFWGTTSMNLINCICIREETIVRNIRIYGIQYAGFMFLKKPFIFWKEIDCKKEMTRIVWYLSKYVFSTDLLCSSLLFWQRKLATAFFTNIIFTNITLRQKTLFRGSFLLKNIFLLL